MECFQNMETDSVIGDVLFVNSKDLSKKTRYYSAKDWNPNKFVKGFMPPHPSFFVRRSFYEKCGLYKINYKIAADYELLIRFLKINNLKYQYIQKPLVLHL